MLPEHCLLDLQGKASLDFSTTLWNSEKIFEKTITNSRLYIPNSLNPQGYTFPSGLRVQFSQTCMHDIFPIQTIQNRVPSQSGLFSAPTLRLNRDGMLFSLFFSGLTAFWLTLWVIHTKDKFWCASLSCFIGHYFFPATRLIYACFHIPLSFCLIPPALSIQAIKLVCGCVVQQSFSIFTQLFLAWRAHCNVLPITSGINKKKL